MGEIKMNIFDANTNPGSPVYYKTRGTSKRATKTPTFHINKPLPTYVERPEPAKAVAKFGIIDRHGKDIITGWKVCDVRGNDHESPKGKGFSKYGADLFNSMFAGWS